jgi:hypothetical protein
MILEDDRCKIAINPDKFDKLITSLRTAVDNDGTLDKEATSYNDIFDAFRLALKFYSFRDGSEYDYLLYLQHDEDKVISREIIFDSLVTQTSNKHLWIKRATGLGISEFVLRFMAWLCFKDNTLVGSQMCIVTGPRID